jgi:outer membrane protein OmpA-like peptidoglycan-associated protein
MNKPLRQKAHSIKRALGLGLTMVFISACADRGSVVMEAQVEQLQNLQDYDNDGVIEAREKCADTLLGASIDNYGCGTQTSTTEPFNVDIKFANNSFTIPSEASDEVSELAEFIVRNPKLQVLIEGHTSQVGSVLLNKTLSVNRAKAIMSTLVNDFDIAEQRLTAIGYGFKQLKESGETEYAHSVNRRIEAQLSQSYESDDMKWTIYTVDQVQ